MKCHKCQNEMQMTPVCCECGILPLAETSFRERDERIARLLGSFERVLRCKEIGTAHELARMVLSANEKVEAER